MHACCQGDPGQNCRLDPAQSYPVQSCKNFDQLAATKAGAARLKIALLFKMLLRGIEWVILAQYRGSAFFGPILLFDRYHPSAPTCTRDTPTRAAAVKDGPPSGHHRREASLTATSTTA
jgi:hypothetical protein